MGREGSWGVWWHRNIPGSHRTPSQGFSGAAAGWEGELVQALHFSAAHPAAHIRKDVLPAGFLFPSGRRFPISSTILCSSWQAGDAPLFLGHHCVPSRNQRRSSLWIQTWFCRWCQRIEACIGAALLPCLSRGIPDVLGGRSQTGVVQEGRGGWWLNSDSGAASTARGTSRGCRWQKRWQWKVCLSQGKVWVKAALERS